MPPLNLNQSHHLPETLGKAFGEGTTAQWAVNPTGKAIIFVHGFQGEALDTWTDFPTLLTEDARLTGVDLIFYGYDGLYTQAGVSSLMFLQFLEQLFTAPNSLLGKALQPRHNFTYSSVVIAAHSLGAVVTRRALLDAEADGSAWIDKVRLVFFAPAHSGAYAAVLASAYLSSQDWWLGKIAGAAAAYNLPLLEDLKPGSVVLAALDADTRKALQAKPKAGHLVAHTVVWADDDKVVINHRFGGDPRAKLIRGSDHRRVCKPLNDFRDPVDYLLAAL